MASKMDFKKCIYSKFGITICIEKKDNLHSHLIIFKILLKIYECPRIILIIGDGIQMAGLLFIMINSKCCYSLDVRSSF